MIPRLALVVLLLAVAACRTTTVHLDHPQIAAPADAERATVYFLRPDPGSLVRIGPVQVFLDDAVLLEICCGDYAVVHLKPHLGSVGAGEAAPESTQQLALFGGETCYVRIDAGGGPLGVDLVTTRIERAEAAELAARLRPVGDAVGEPIGSER